MKDLSVAFLLLGIAALLFVPRLGMLGWLPLWAGLDFLAVSWAYRRHLPGIYGKRPDGGMDPLRVLLFAPHLGLIAGVWHVNRLVSREPPCNWLGDGLIVSRRLLKHEMPPGVTTVVDLTAEFREVPALRSMNYRSLPVMDGEVPDAGELSVLLGTLPREAGTVLVHCAEGHGRTGAVAACLLLWRGAARGAAEAVDMVITARPLARLLPRQRAFVDDFARRIAESSPG